MGGWYIQPDCNMPSGESFIRHILHGKAYFKKQFNVDITTAINFDPFGHTRGLVQILAKSGFDSYLFGRPHTDIKLPNHQFIWVGYDGSEILATRFIGWYNTPLGRAAEVIEERINANSENNVLAILWGVGNHGGGPSRKDLKQVNKLIKNYENIVVAHSTPERYFKELNSKKFDLPRWEQDFNPWGVGCYTSQIRIKQNHRLLENELYLTEKMASAAATAGLLAYPKIELIEATEALLFSEFHDILPGSSIQPVEEMSLGILNHGLSIVNKVKTRAFFALSYGQPRAKKGEIPILVYNPHPFRIKTKIECELNLADFNQSGTYTQIRVFQKHKEIPAQVDHELSNMPLDWRKRVVFWATLEPSTMNRFNCRTHLLPSKPSHNIGVSGNHIHFKTAEIDVLVNTRTGIIDRYAVNGVNYLSKCAFVPMAICDTDDSWRMTGTQFDRKAYPFKLLRKSVGSKFSGLAGTNIDSVRIIEDGPVHCIIEAVMGFQESFICQRYKLPKIGTEIEVEIRVFWNQKDQLLKLCVPFAKGKYRYLGQVAFGTGELPVDGTEAVAQKWVAVVNDKTGACLTCINDGTYGSDFYCDQLRLTLLRSPAYSACSITGKRAVENDRFTTRMDQGERLFRFWFNAGNMNQRLLTIDREALVHNEKPDAISFFPSGQGQSLKSLAILNDKVVQITTIKQAHTGEDYIIRLYNPTGKARKFVLTLPIFGRKLKLSLGRFEVKTVRVSRRGHELFDVDMIENRVQ